MLEGSYKDTVTLLGVRCDVEVHYQYQAFAGCTPFCAIKKVIGPLGDDIKASLSSPAAMDGATCRIIGGKVYWYGASQIDVLYGSLWYRVNTGRIG